jgi:hypothetical protein
VEATSSAMIWIICLPSAHLLGKNLLLMCKVSFWIHGYAKSNRGSMLKILLFELCMKLREEQFSNTRYSLIVLRKLSNIWPTRTWMFIPLSRLRSVSLIL